MKPSDVSVALDSPSLYYSWDVYNVYKFRFRMRAKTREQSDLNVVINNIINNGIVINDD